MLGKSKSFWVLARSLLAPLTFIMFILTQSQTHHADCFNQLKAQWDSIQARHFYASSDRQTYASAVPNVLNDEEQGEKLPWTLPTTHQLY